jgi:hypothetical protein
MQKKRFSKFFGFTEKNFYFFLKNFRGIFMAIFISLLCENSAENLGDKI